MLFEQEWGTIIATIKVKYKNFFLLDQPLGEEIARLNFQRILLMIYVMAPVHISHIAVFGALLIKEDLSPPDVIYYWRIGIIWAHLAILFLICIFALLSFHFRKTKREHTSAGSLTLYLVAVSYLLFGTVVCIIDQLITAAINPFLIANMAVALVMFLKPHIAAITYIMNYLILNTALPLTQTNAELLSSVRVNGITAMGIGIGLSIIMWRTSAVNMVQKRLIERQKQELEKKNEQLEKISREDSLTGIYNRMYFRELAEREIERLKRTGEESSLLLFDIDYFKRVNDNYGHPNGDVVLKYIADLTKKELRKSDIFARFGGEEFIILLPGTSLEGARLVAEKIRHALSECSFDGPLSSLGITASFGLTIVKTDETPTFDDAYRKVDQALYLAKNNGRNCVR